jgi:type VI secretion system protein ImpH
MTDLAALARDPAAFHVFHALRLIEARLADRPRLGRSARPAEDAVRLGQSPDLAFPTATLTEFAAPTDGAPGRLDTRFFGLFGPNGPLPLHLTEYARDRLRNERDPTLTAFANLFTHRMLSLLYRAYAAGQPAPSFDRRDDDPFGRWVAALAGYGGRELEDRDPMPDLAKRHFAGRLGCGAKSAEALVAMVGAFFRTRVTLVPFVGGWLELDRRERWRLGARAGLGRATNIGRRVWSREARFRLRLGPMSLADYRRLLPGGVSLARLDAIVRNYAGDALDWDVNLVLRGDEVPPAVLGRDAALGHVCWIGRRDPATDADDLRLTPADARPPADAGAEANRGEG